jgi:hypothetical protein
MSEESSFAPPPFKPADALLHLKKQLRDLRLTERAGSFELKGQAIVALRATDAAIEARLVRRPARTPEWTTHVLGNGADVRKFVDTVKRSLAGWSED